MKSAHFLSDLIRSGHLTHVPHQHEVISQHPNARYQSLCSFFYDDDYGSSSSCSVPKKILGVVLKAPEMLKREFNEKIFHLNTSLMLRE